MAADSTGELTFLGTATTLLRFGSFTLLTDPNFLHRGERAYLGYGLTSKRLTEPAFQPQELPELDAVVLSHRHGDHWDRRARSGLARDLPVLTTPHAAKRLRLIDRFPHAVGLSTWRQHRIEKAGESVRVTALPGVHSTNPLLARLLPPVMGSMLEWADAAGTVVRRVYVTGDTMLFSGLDEISARYSDIDTVVVHGGGTTLPGGFVVTMTGADAVALVGRMRPRAAVAVHYDDYGVFRSGLDDLRRELDAAQLPVEWHCPARGETVPL